jgi:V8-like Glu-specific endopeptidase
MLKLSNLLFLSLFVISTHAFALVFETDQRFDVSAAHDPAVQILAKSVFTFIPKSKLAQQKDGTYKFVDTKTLKTLVNLCANESFADEMTVGSRCSGFLASPDLAVTAGHCVSPPAIPNFCQDYYIVFDYIRANGETPSSLAADSVQECSAIKKIDFSDKPTSADYAVLQLTKTIKDRKPLEYRKSGKIKKTEGLFMLGYLRGMSQKVSENGSIVNNSHKAFFSTKLDCFHGNSGSPVFNAQTHLVEGLFVRGNGHVPNETTDPNLIGDFYFDQSANCNRTLVCKKSEGCTGVMEATRSTLIRL